ncbi:unnamed protein product [Schistosoma margrebowiei]|uniref:Uncharacterized protein n=1 Tax=Schistosoma margrebowiei TaxID=48269 RepID=A0A183NC07_9TREM|nr:unnamed protein product [Schistosoma margrebowiei]
MLANSNQSDIYQTTNQSQLANSNQSEIRQATQNQLFTLKKWCLSKRKTLRQAGEWAVVTGASSGIGEAYAEELAKEGLNIMLISNDEEQLSTVANRIENTYNVQTRIVVADFTKVISILNESVNHNNLKSLSLT